MGVPLAAAGFVSINAAVATGAGLSFAVSGCAKFSIQVVLTGSPGTAIVKLEGTLDTSLTDANNHWFTLATWDVTTPQTSGDILFVTDKPISRIRANCTTLTTGTGKSATAVLAAA